MITFGSTQRGKVKEMPASQRGQQPAPAGLGGGRESAGRGSCCQQPATVKTTAAFSQILAGRISQIWIPVDQISTPCFNSQHPPKCGMVSDTKTGSYSLANNYLGRILQRLNLYFCFDHCYIVDFHLALSWSGRDSIILVLVYHCSQTYRALNL